MSRPWQDKYPICSLRGDGDDERFGVGLLVWWQFLRGFPGRCSCLRTQGGIVGPGFSTKIHQECSHDAQ